MPSSDVRDALGRRQQGEIRWIDDGRFGAPANAGPPRRRVRSLLAGADLVDVADDLVEVDAERARMVLVYSLRHDLAYDAEVMPEAEADAVAAAFFGLIAGSAAQFFTNRLQDAEPSDRPLGYDRIPCSDSTFDSLVVAVGAESAALVCILDED